MLIGVMNSGHVCLEKLEGGEYAELAVIKTGFLGWRPTKKYRLACSLCIGWSRRRVRQRELS